jgi:uncharacterized protein YjiS (DUF1127 family)
MSRTLGSAIRGASERARRRRDYATLLDYDDRMLDDIGIRREDIRKLFGSRGSSI